MKPPNSFPAPERGGEAFPRGTARPRGRTTQACVKVYLLRALLGRLGWGDLGNDPTAKRISLASLSSITRVPTRLFRRFAARDLADQLAPGRRVGRYASGPLSLRGVWGSSRVGLVRRRRRGLSRRQRRGLRNARHSVTAARVGLALSRNSNANRQPAEPSIPRRRGGSRRARSGGVRKRRRRKVSSTSFGARFPTSRRVSPRRRS